MNKLIDWLWEGYLTIEAWLVIRIIWYNEKPLPELTYDELRRTDWVEFDNAILEATHKRLSVWAFVEMP